MKFSASKHDWITIFAICLQLACSSTTIACDIRVSFADDAELFPARDFGLPSSTALINPLRIELTSKQSGCNATIGFATDNQVHGNHHLTNNGRRITYWLASSPNGSVALADLPVAQHDAVLRGPVPTQYPTLFQYYMIVPGHQVATPGTYRDRIVISVYSETGGFPQLTSMHSVNVSLTVKPELDLQILAGIAVSGSGPGVHSIDFGELQTGEQVRFRIKVSANVAYDVSVRSENGGKFRHVSRPQASIPYTVQVGNRRAADIRRPISLAAVPAIGSRVSFHPMTITVGSVEHSLAGEYRDRLLITVQAQ